MAKKRNKPVRFSAKFLIEVGQIASAGIPLTTEQAAAYCQLTPGSLSVMRCLRARAERLGKPITARHGPKVSYVGTSPRYTKIDLDEWRARGVHKEVAVGVGRPPVGRGKKRVAA
jgi:hypothetical protein